MELQELASVMVSKLELIELQKVQLVQTTWPQWNMCLQPGFVGWWDRAQQ